MNGADPESLRPGRRAVAGARRTEPGGRTGRLHPL